MKLVTETAYCPHCATDQRVDTDGRCWTCMGPVVRDATVAPLLDAIGIGDTRPDPAPTPPKLAPKEPKPFATSTDPECPGAPTGIACKVCGGREARWTRGPLAKRCEVCSESTRSKFRKPTLPVAPFVVLDEREVSERAARLDAAIDAGEIKPVESVDFVAEEWGSERAAAAPPNEYVEQCMSDAGVEQAPDAGGGHTDCYRIDTTDRDPNTIIVDNGGSAGEYVAWQDVVNYPYGIRPTPFLRPALDAFKAGILERLVVSLAPDPPVEPGEVEAKALRVVELAAKLPALARAVDQTGAAFEAAEKAWEAAHAEHDDALRDYCDAVGTTPEERREAAE